MSFPVDRYDPVDAIRKIATDDYFDAIEITDYEDEEKKNRIRGLLKQSHLQVGYGTQPVILREGLNPNSLIEEERQYAQKRLLEELDEAASFEAEGFSFMAGKWETSHKEEGLKQLEKTALALCRRGQELGIRVELEVFDYDMDKKVLIGPAPLAARLASDLRQAIGNFGLLVELSHFPTTYEDSLFVVRQLRPYLTHFHIGNAVVTEGKEAYGDKHPRFGYPDSANDVPELRDFLEVLQGEGFMNQNQPFTMSFEVSPRPWEDGEIVLANAKRVLNRAWALADGRRGGYGEWSDYPTRR